MDGGERKGRAENRISPSRLYQFARALAVPVAWFFDGLPPTSTGRIRVVIPEYELQSARPRPWLKPITRSLPNDVVPFTG